jgi:transketolase
LFERNFKDCEGTMPLTTSLSQKTKSDIDNLCINTIRTLAMDAVEKANSGHPGTPMALAPLMYVLWTRLLRYNPKNPNWFNRDRFVLSNGHASMLQYAVLYLTGFDLSLADIKNFRQWGSKTPGHPENSLTPGVETTTGPLGQGVMNAVGMAMAEAHLARKFNRHDISIVDHRTYAFCSDGDLMEGASHEAASIAGHFKLGKLTFVYDNNHISIEGKTELTFSDDVARRFDAYHWHVQNLGEKANDIEAIEKAFQNAQSVTDRPSLIIVRSHIGYGSPNKQDTKEAHGSPLGPEEVKLTKRFYGWDENKSFYVPDEVLKYMRKMAEAGQELENRWNDLFESYRNKYPQLYKAFTDALNNSIPSDWDSDIPEFAPDDGPIATRKAGSKILNSIASKVPWLIGGSGDLAPSTKTLIDDSDYFEAGQYDNRNIAWGIREMGMCACSSGMALHGGIRPYAATFFIFTDYARPAIRLACLMKLPVIYVMTHDSIGLGEDGPTHQPIEHLASLRAMPGMCVIRPADANETAWAWKAAIQRTDGPTMLVFTRQKLPVLDRTRFASAAGVLKGAYVLSKESKESPDVILMASGSEVQLILAAQEKLRDEKIDARVVSMPSWELFALQSETYRNEILPKRITKRLAVEAGSPFGWCQWIGDKGDVIGITRYGASAPAAENFKHYGFTVDNIVERTKGIL